MIEIDIRVDIERAQRQLMRYERRAIPQATARSINKTLTNVTTAVNRKIAANTGLKIKEIKSGQFRRNASMRFLSASVTQRRRAFNLRRFVRANRLRVGGFAKEPGVRANPWRNSKIFEGAFIIRGRTSGQLVVVARRGKNRYPLKSLYGPSLHVEFNRAPIRRLANVIARRRFRVNFRRDLAYYVSRIR